MFFLLLFPRIIQLRAQLLHDVAELLFHLVLSLPEELLFLHLDLDGAGLLFFSRLCILLCGLLRNRNVRWYAIFLLHWSGVFRTQVYV